MSRPPAIAAKAPPGTPADTAIALAREIAAEVNVSFTRLGQLAHDQRGGDLSARGSSAMLRAGSSHAAPIEAPDPSIWTRIARRRSVGERSASFACYVGCQLLARAHRPRCADRQRQLVARELLPVVGTVQDRDRLHGRTSSRSPVVDLVDVVEEGEELVVFALRDRVELVVVARAQPTVRPRKTVPVVSHAVDDRLDAELLAVDAAFLVDRRVAVEAGGDQLLAVVGFGSRSPASLLDRRTGRTACRG